jgi:hypothetical protein
MLSDLPVTLKVALPHTNHNRKLVSVSQGTHVVHHQSTYLDAENEGECSHCPTTSGR